MNVTLCMPSVRGAGAVGPLISACNQSKPPLRCLVYDVSKDGLDLTSPPALAAGMLKVEIHRGPSGTHQLQAQKYLAQQATTDWILFVDDDVWLWHDALEKLCEAVQNTGAVLAGAVRMDLDHKLYLDPTHHINDPYYGTASMYMRPQTRQALTLDGLAFLVRRDVFLSCDTSYQPILGEGGNDTYLMSQISSKNLTVVAHDALAIHIQPYETAASGWPPGTPWYKKHIEPMLGQEMFDRLLRSTRIPWKSATPNPWKRS